MKDDPLKIAYNRIGPIGEVTFCGPDAHIIQNIHNMVCRTYNAMYERSDDPDYKPVLIIYVDHRRFYEMESVDGGARVMMNNDGQTEWMGIRVVRVLEDHHLACVCINPPDTNCQRILAR